MEHWVPQNTELPWDPAILLLGKYPRKLKMYVIARTPTWMITSLFKMAQTVETQMSINWCINQMSHGNTMECYSTPKRNEVLIPIITWMNIEHIMLSGKSQIKRPHILFIWNVQNRQLYKTENLVNGCLGLGGRGKRNWLLVSKDFWGMKKMF